MISKAFQKGFFQSKDGTHKNQAKVNELSKGETSNNRGSEIKCFKCLGQGHMAAQCPTKRTIVLKGHDLSSSQDESSSSDSESSHS